MLTGAALAGLGVALAVGAAPARRLNVIPRRRPTLPRWVWLSLAAAALLAVALGVSGLVWACIGVVMVGTISYLGYGHRKRRQAKARAEECARAARVLAGLLRTGQVPVLALGEAASECEVLRRAATASTLGGDVAAELRREAKLPGQDGLVAVAAAWQVSERSGAPIAEVLELVSENLRRQRQLEAVIDTELSAARTSGQIMAVLPLLAVGLGFLVGINTISYLAGDPLGQLLLLAGVVLTACGVLWIDWLAANAAKGAVR